MYYIWRDSYILERCVQNPLVGCVHIEKSKTGDNLFSRPIYAIIQYDEYKINKYSSYQDLLDCINEHIRPALSSDCSNVILTDNKDREKDIIINTLEKQISSEQREFALKTNIFDEMRRQNNLRERELDILSKKNKKEKEIEKILNYIDRSSSTNIRLTQLIEDVLLRTDSVKPV